MSLINKIKLVRYPAHWKRIRGICGILMPAGFILVLVILFSTATYEIVYVEQEITTSLGTTRTITLPRTVTSFPMITWIILIAFIASLVIFSIVDFIAYRCMSCGVRLSFYTRRGFSQYYIRNCPRCRADIEEMDEGHRYADMI